MVTEEEPPSDSPDQSELAAPEEETQGSRVSRLVFPVAGYGILLSEGSSMEFLEDQTPSHIPNRHPLFQGLINRRGSLVPVFELRELFGTNTVDGDAKQVLVIGSGDNAVGIVLDSTPHRATMDDDREVSPPERVAEVFGKFVEDCKESDNGERLTRISMEDFLHDLAHEFT